MNYDKEYMETKLADGAAKLGITLPGGCGAALTRYAELMAERNKSMNLTRITEADDVITKHFLDSLTALTTGLVKGKVIDIGSGAGLPGLVLGCAKPDISLTLLDSLGKRVAFLKEAAEVMGIKADAVHARAEDAAHLPNMRESFDTVVSRAVARMRTLSEWCLPFLKVGGYFLALKGPLAEEELDDAKAAVKILGGKVVDIAEADIPFTDLRHRIVIVKKVRHTPTQFPRKGGKPTAVPIEKAYKTRKR